MNNSPAREHYLSLLEKHGRADKRRDMDAVAHLVARMVLSQVSVAPPTGRLIREPD